MYTQQFTVKGQSNWKGAEHSERKRNGATTLARLWRLHLTPAWHSYYYFCELSWAELSWAFAWRKLMRSRESRARERERREKGWWNSKATKRESSTTTRTSIVPFFLTFVLLFVAVLRAVAFCLLTLECIASGYWQQSTHCRPNEASKFRVGGNTGDFLAVQLSGTTIWRQCCCNDFETCNESARRMD